MEAYREIRQAIAQNKMEHARDLLRDVLKAEPESAEVWYLAALAARNDAQKRAFLEKSVELDPLYAPAANALHRLDSPAEFDLLPDPPALKKTAIPAAENIAGRRLAAAVVDAIVIGVLQFMAFFMLTLFLNPVAVAPSTTMMDTAAMNQGALVMFVLLAIPAAYYTLSLSRMNGQTIGKRLLNLRVVKREGGTLTAWDAFLRCYIGYLLSAAALGMGFLWMLTDAQQQGWHDMVADTLVISG